MSQATLHQRRVCNFAIRVKLASSKPVLVAPLVSLAQWVLPLPFVVSFRAQHVLLARSLMSLVRVLVSCAFPVPSVKTPEVLVLHRALLALQAVISQLQVKLTAWTVPWVAMFRSLVSQNVWLAPLVRTPVRLKVRCA